MTPPLTYFTQHTLQPGASVSPLLLHIDNALSTEKEAEGEISQQSPKNMEQKMPERSHGQQRGPQLRKPEETQEEQNHWDGSIATPRTAEAHRSPTLVTSAFCTRRWHS